MGDEMAQKHGAREPRFVMRWGDTCLSISREYCSVDGRPNLLTEIKSVAVFIFDERVTDHSSLFFVSCSTLRYTVRTD